MISKLDSTIKKTEKKHFLITDSCTTHNVTCRLENKSLNNCTIGLQPPDLDIIQEEKFQYKSQVLSATATHTTQKEITA